VGRQQIERIQKNAASPRWGWSGVREIVPPLWSEAELRRVATIGMHRHVKSPGAWSFIDEPTIAVKLQINLTPAVRKNFDVERLP
jgi:hypothetical protein